METWVGDFVFCSYFCGKKHPNSHNVYVWCSGHWSVIQMFSDAVFLTCFSVYFLNLNDPSLVWSSILVKLSGFHWPYSISHYQMHCIWLLLPSVYFGLRDFVVISWNHNILDLFCRDQNMFFYFFIDTSYVINL